MSVDEHIAHGEVLRQTHQRVVHRRIAVGMITTKHIADAGGGFLKWLIGGQSVFVHGVENAAVHGLQTVPHIRQRAPDDDRHGILQIALFHFMDKLRGHNRLFREQDVLRLVVLLMCQNTSSLIRKIVFVVPSGTAATRSRVAQSQAYFLHASSRSIVQILHMSGVLLNELLARFHLFTHQERKDLIRLHRVLQLDAL